MDRYKRSVAQIDLVKLSGSKTKKGMNRKRGFVEMKWGVGCLFKGVKGRYERCQYSAYTICVENSQRIDLIKDLKR